MSSVTLQIAAPAHRITLEVMLRAAGHTISDTEAGVLITDDCRLAAREAGRIPTLILTPAAGIPDAVAAMRAGAFGYIFLPLQPGEAPLMVERAVQASVPSATRPLPVVQEQPDKMAPLEQAERRHVEEVLRLCRGNRAQAARRLGIGRNTLWRKLRRYGLEEVEP